MVQTSETAVEISDRIDPARAAALMTALGIEARPPQTGEPLPPFFHQIYFWDLPTPDELGADGHRRAGGLIPDMGGRHRMWAGGRLTFHAPFAAGIAARKVSRLTDITEKEGATGPLTFVTLRHIIHQRGEPVLTEEQALVYRATAYAADTARPDAPRHAEERRPFNVSASTLFRYSALTLNAHRIHYDTAYCHEHEGYPGLVVHGPLIAQALALLAAERLGALASFSYRARRPLFEGQAATLCAAGLDLWLEGPDGAPCMTAAATPRR